MPFSDPAQPARPLTLVEQCAYTSGLCYLFARTAHRVVGGVPSVLWTTEPKVLARHDQPDGVPLELHAFLTLEDGNVLDAEGVRTLDQMCRAFGLRSMRHRRVETMDISRWETESDSSLSHRLEARLRELGWGQSLPLATGALEAPGAYARARAQLDQWWPQWQAHGTLPIDSPPPPSRSTQPRP